MRISLETDYAVRIVQCLANEGVRMGAKEISDKTGVTAQFTLKILRKLVAADIAKSYKGVGGGYELSRDPALITLKQVIEVIEGPLVIGRCSGENSARCDDCVCYFHYIFDEAARDLAKRFDSVNFTPKRCSLRHTRDEK